MRARRLEKCPDFPSFWTNICIALILRVITIAEMSEEEWARLVCWLPETLLSCSFGAYLCAILVTRPQRP